jgi:hypothetical protein
VDLARGCLPRGLRELGYIEGRNVVIEYRFAEGQYARLPELAAELVRLKVDVIVTHSAPGALAAKQATAANRIPVVITNVSDAVGAGVVASLARPGGTSPATRSSFGACREAAGAAEGCEPAAAPGSGAHQSGQRGPRRRLYVQWKRRRKS